MRAETGVMKFGTDWSGVFIRGDDAMYYALVLVKIDISSLTPLEAEAVNSLRELFSRCHENMGALKPASRQHLRSFVDALRIS